MVITRKGILAEAVARKELLLKANKIELIGEFPQQQSFVEDTNRFIAAQCSRRAGKTNGLVLRFLKTMEKHPKSQSLYLALTQDSAREIMWPALNEMNDKYNIGLEFTESKLEIKHPNGAKLKLMGADLKNFIKRLKGRKYPAVAIDEAQDFSSHLQSLIDDVLTPSIADYEDGWLALTGTPGPVPQGYFFKVTQEKQYGYSIHSWTIMDNPFMPKPQEFLADLIDKNKWESDHPTLLREWRNKWVLDTNSLWVRYNEKTNHYAALPTDAAYKWNYILGVDIGFNDADAIAVLAWSETSDTTYLVEEIINSKQGISKLIDQIETIQKKYNAYKIVMDEGGLGKKIAEDLRQRFGCPIEAADKAHKQSNVEFLNDYLRLGRFKAGKASRFAQDSYLVQIDRDKSTPSRTVLKKTPHSDIIDSVLYAFRESYSYANKPPESPPPTWGSKAWAKKQEEDMFEAELEGMMQDEEHNKWLKGK